MVRQSVTPMVTFDSKLRIRAFITGRGRRAESTTTLRFWRSYACRMRADDCTWYCESVRARNGMGFGSLTLQVVASDAGMLPSCGRGADAVSVFACWGDGGSFQASEPLSCWQCR